MPWIHFPGCQEKKMTKELWSRLSTRPTCLITAYKSLKFSRLLHILFPCPCCSLCIEGSPCLPTYCVYLLNFSHSSRPPLRCFPWYTQEKLIPPSSVPPPYRKEFLSQCFLYPPHLFVYMTASSPGCKFLEGRGRGLFTIYFLFLVHCLHTIGS